MTRWMQWLFPPPPAGRAAVGLLVLRSFAGIALMTHGARKIANPFHWMDESTWPAPAWLQLLAAVSESLGGLALVIGLFATVASFGVLCTMAVAVATHVAKHDPFRRWELPALFAVVALLLLLTGPGAISLDAWIARRLRRSPPPS